MTLSSSLSLSEGCRDAVTFEAERGRVLDGRRSAVGRVLDRCEVEDEVEVEGCIGGGGGYGGYVQEEAVPGGVRRYLRR